MRLAAAILALTLAATAPAQEAPRALTLDEARALALEKNPDLATARSRVAIARAGLQQADAAFWPRVRLGGGYTASDNPVQAFMMTLNQRAFDFGANFNNPATTDNLNGHVAATWSLYNGGRDLAQRQAAQLGVAAGEHALVAARHDLVFEVTRAFHTIGKARGLVAAATAAVSSMESNLVVATQRFNEGAALKTEPLDAAVRLAEAREDLVTARNALALAETIFRNALGVAEAENFTAAPPPTRPAAVAEATDRLRPELRVARQAVAMADKHLRAATGGYLPRVDAFASYDLDSGDASRYADSWVAGVSVSVDVFDGFLTRGRVAEARARAALAREELRGLELTLAREVKQARLNLAAAAARLETTARAVAQAEESRQIVRERYAAGLALLTQALDADSALTSARQRRAIAEADQAIAEAALQRALGTILEEGE